MQKVKKIYNSLNEKSRVLLGKDFVNHFNYKYERQLYNKIIKDELDFVEENFVMNWFLSNGYKEEVENLNQISESA